MTNTIPLKAKAASLVLGIVGAFYLISLIISLGLINPHESLLRLGCGLIFVSLALEPEILFRTMSLAEAKRPLNRSRLVVALSILGAVCLAAAGLVWLAS